MTNRDVCLATVTTESFVPGTLVMVHSFIATNPWFNGDIVVIHDRLNPEYQRHLAHIHPNVQLLEVSDQLRARVHEIAQAFPDFVSRRARFYSLDAFRLRGYRKVLFCDSDVLFRRPIPELFELPQPLVVCGDGPFYLDCPRQWRARHSHVPGSGAQVMSYRNTFNSGVMLIGREFLTDDHYGGLLDVVDADMDESGTTIADQVVLNLYFGGRQHLVSAKYNYVLAHRAAIYEKEGLGLTEAHVLHYNGPVKPWLADRLLHASQRDPAMIKACAFWFEAYVACLQQLYLQNCVERARTCVTPEATP